MPELSAVQERWAKRGFTVVGIPIDQDREKQVNEFLEKTPVTYPVVEARLEQMLAAD